MTKLKLFDC